MTTTNAQHNLNKIYEVFNENQLWDDIYVDLGEDNRGEHFTVFGDWSSQSKFIDNVKEILELDPDMADYQVEKELETNFVFDDEYDFCSDCHAVIRMSPSHYGWQPDFMIGDGYIACNKCFNNNEDYQEAYIEDRVNNPTSAINGLITEKQIEELGFTKANNDSYESGLHYGQNDDPETIYNTLKNDYSEVIFFIDGVGQFDIDFSVWVR